MGFNTYLVSQLHTDATAQSPVHDGMRAMEDSTFLQTAAFNYNPKNLSLVKVIPNSNGLSIMAELENTEVCWKVKPNSWRDIRSQYCVVNSKKLMIFICFTKHKTGILQQTI
jgi:hypothetical protein